MSNSQIRGEAYSGGCFGPRGARSWLFMGFVLGFAAMIAACWIFFADFVASKSKKNYKMKLIIKNIIIIIIIFRYKYTKHDSWI